jgi:CheY-like chemotaxis protein
MNTHLSLPTTGHWHRVARHNPRGPVPKPNALVVDDVPDITHLLGLMVEHAGYEITEAFSAPEALLAARAQPFALIVSDVAMPVMDGYELAKELRRLPEYSDVPMIAVTSFDSHEERARALAAGFTAHLRKPIDPVALNDLIVRLES